MVILDKKYFKLIIVSGSKYINYCINNFTGILFYGSKYNKCIMFLCYDLIYLYNIISIFIHVCIQL